MPHDVCCSFQDSLKSTRDRDSFFPLLISLFAYGRLAISKLRKWSDQQWLPSVNDEKIPPRMRVTIFLSPSRLTPGRPLRHASGISASTHFDSLALYHVLTRSHQLGLRTSLPHDSWGFISQSPRNASYEQKAKDLNQQGVDEALSEFDTAVAEDQEKQHRAPWHRQGAEEPPVRRQRSAGAMTKGTSNPIRWTSDMVY